MLNQKLEMITLREQSVLKAQVGCELDLFPQLATLWKEKLLEEIKSTSPVNTVIVRKQNSFIADRKVSVVWPEAQTSHNIPLSHSLILVRP